ncbi:MAG: hypothetical protein ABMB14_09670 [Myxococcota bacterium]
MNPLEFDAFAIAARLARALDDGGVPYAIGGAIAYGLWGDPRGTYDVDINLFVGREQLDRALDVIEAAGVTLDREAARRADLDGDVIVGWCDGLRIDLFTPSIPFSWEAMNTRVRLTGPLGSAAYLSAEATAVFKLLFFRSKDRVDLEKLVAVQGGDLDAAYVRRWMVDMMGEDDIRVQEWDRILTAYGPR